MALVVDQQFSVFSRCEVFQELSDIVEGIKHTTEGNLICDLRSSHLKINPAVLRSRETNGKANHT